MMSRRYLSLWLPRFLTDRLRAGPDPLATLVEEAGVPRIVAANTAAAALGIASGMALADARALPAAVEPLDVRVYDSLGTVVYTLSLIHI